MKTINDFMTLVQSGAQPVVEFKSGIVDKESYAEKGMRARALRVLDDGKDVVKIAFSFSEFDAHNVPLETANYYDKSGNPTLTARQAGYYKPEEDLYFGPDESLDNLLTLIADDRIELFTQYRESGASQSYVSWLEDKILQK